MRYKLGRAAHVTTSSVSLTSPPHPLHFLLALPRRHLRRLRLVLPSYGLAFRPSSILLPALCPDPPLVSPAAHPRTSLSSVDSLYFPAIPHLNFAMTFLVSRSAAEEEGLLTRADASSAHVTLHRFSKWGNYSGEASRAREPPSSTSKARELLGSGHVTPQQVQSVLSDSAVVQWRS